FALAMRRSLPETFVRQPHIRAPRPTAAQVWLGVLTLAMLASATVATYTLNYLNIFATHTLGLSPAKAFGAVVVGGTCGMIFNPIGGRLSDRLGRKPVMLVAYGFLCVAGPLCFLLMSHLRTALALYA